MEGRSVDGMEVLVLFQYLDWRHTAFSSPCPQRKLKGEGAPSKSVTLDADMSLVGLDGHPAKSKSKTGGINAPFCLFFKLPEFVEDDLLVSRGDAGASILHFEQDVFRVCIVEPYGNGFS
jgi:hypothetical protein